MRCDPTRKNEIFGLFVVPSGKVEMRVAEDARACSTTSFHLLLLLLLRNRGIRMTLSFVDRVVFPEIAGFHQGVL